MIGPNWLALAVALLAGVEPAQGLRVGRNVQVSRANGGDPHAEVLVAADPTDPSRLLVASIYRPPGATLTIAYLSLDGGETWQPTLQVPATVRAAGSSSDPAITYAPDGTALFLSSLLPPNSSGPTRRMLLYRSPDGGRNWQPPVYFTYSDREYIVVDRTEGPYRGRIYVNGNSRVGETAGSLTVFHSSDNGQTFTESRMPKLPAAREMGNAVVLADGTVAGLFTSAADGAKAGPEAPAVLRISRSKDGGQSFGPPVDVAAAVLVAGRKGDHNNSLALPAMAVDASAGPFRDRLYVVWPEYRSGHTDIYLCRSADGGLTWSTPRRVNDAPESGAETDAVDHFMATVAVNPDGVLGVMWYDRRGHPDNIGWDVRFTASLDGGQSFLPSVRVSEKGSTFDGRERWVLDSRVAKAEGGKVRLDLSLDTFTFLGGDTAGLTADGAGRFHPVWVDNSTGIPQVFTAVVTVPRTSEAAIRQSRKEGAVRRSVTGEVTVESDEPEYDRSRDLVSVGIRLLNNSPQPLTGPLSVRIADVQSELGDPQALNADRGGGGVDAEWDIPMSTPTLNPGERTRTATLTFHLSHLRPYRDGKRYRRGLVKIEFEVLGGPASAGSP